MYPPTPLFSLVYCSRAAPGVDAGVVHDIVAGARAHNAGQHITGLLVYGNGVFFQWLEGPRDEVQRLMERIHSDPRHGLVVELAQNEELRERLFPDWDMELVGPEALREVIEDALAEAEDRGAPQSAALRALLARVEVARLAGFQ